MFDAGYRMLGAGARRWSREMIWGGRWEGDSGLGACIHPWWIHVNVWQNQYSIVKWNKVKILKLIKNKTIKKKVGDAIQPCHSLLSPSSTLNLSQHQGLSQWVSSSHQVTKVLGFQLQHQSFQWIFKTVLYICVSFAVLHTGLSLPSF